jgi:hypothetical protein
MAGHYRLQAAQGQATLKEGRGSRSDGGVARVDDGQEFQRGAVAHGSGLRVDVVLVLKDRQLKRDAELRGGQPHARGLVHHLAHQGYQLLKFGGTDLSIEGGSVLPEHGMASLDNGRQRSGGQDLLDVFPEVRRTERSRRRNGGHGESLAADAVWRRPRQLVSMPWLN